MAFISTPLPLRNRGGHLLRTVSPVQQQSSTCAHSPRQSASTIRTCMSAAQPDLPLSRRAFFNLSLTLAAASMLPSSSDAATEQATLLGDKIQSDIYGYAYRQPVSGWTKTETAISSGRQATIFVRDIDGDSNISMVATPVAGDYTKLASFGSIDNVEKTIIPPTKSDIQGALITSSVDAKKNAYLFEYTITANGTTRHLLTVFSLQPSQCLITMTGQAKEEAWPAAESQIRAVLDSYELIPLD